MVSQFVEDREKIWINIKSSLGTTLKGFFIAVAAALPLGLFIGWSARIGSAATYITKFFSSIPPIVYIPYGIALLPTFQSVSVFVIFLATFWPVFAGTMSGVLGVDKRIIDSAKVLNVRKPEMLFKIILPASLSQIFLGCNQGLSVSFILLTSAEMIGAKDGMGYYVKYYSDFGDYTRTITGLLVIGFVVIAVTFLSISSSSIFYAGKDNIMIRDADSVPFVYYVHRLFNKCVINYHYVQLYSLPIDKVVF